MQIHYMRYALEVGKCKSFSKAAQNLCITQPTLSQQIHALEDELGVQLFTRTKKGVEITEAGEQFISTSEKIIGEIEAVTEQMKHYSRAENSCIKVGCLWIFSDVGVAGLLSDFQVRFPEIETFIMVNGSVKLTQMLSNHELDAAFIIGSEQDMKRKDLHHIVISDNSMNILMKANHPLAEKSFLHYSDIKDESMIIPGEDSNLHRPIMDRLAQFGIKPQVYLYNSNSAASVQFVEQGRGIQFVAPQLYEQCKNPMLIMRPIEDPVHRKICYVTLTENLKIRAIARLTKFVENYQIID